MTGPYCSINGVLVPTEQATVSIDDVNFQYGYGVYETLKVRKGLLYFPEMHEQRLFHSAEIIGLEHALNPGTVQRWTRELILANSVGDANIKQLLIGAAPGGRSDSGTLYIMALNPLFPDRRLYRDGAALITVDGERQWPQAKTLNMLTSTIAYRAAQAAGAYDAILIDRNGFATEGTRTNLYITDGDSVTTTPPEMVLEGVTRTTVNQVITGLGLELIERAFTRDELYRSAGCFITSTSTKVMPVTLVDGVKIPLSPLVTGIMRAYDGFLTAYRNGQQPELQV